jgi:hypothetical protein
MLPFSPDWESDDFAADFSIYGKIWVSFRSRPDRQAVKDFCSLNNPHFPVD